MPYCSNIVLIVINILMAVIIFTEDYSYFIFTLIATTLFLIISFATSKLLTYLYFLISSVVILAFYKFGEITTPMLESVFNNSTEEVISGLSVLSSTEVLGYVGFLFLLFYLIKHSKKITLNKKLIILNTSIITILILGALPIDLLHLSSSLTGIAINLRYKPSSLAHKFLDRYKLFFGPILSVSLILIEENITEKKFDYVKHSLTDKIVLKNTTAKAKNVIFVLGESTNPFRMSSYGYTIKTTPFLDSLKSNGNFYFEEYVHSPSSRTRTSVPMLLSFAKPTHFENLYNLKNILELSHLNSYKTYWLSSQNGFSQYDRPFGFLSQYANIIVTPNKYNNTNFISKYRFDDPLLVPLEYYFKNKSSYNFYILHLYCNHIPYDLNLNDDDINKIPSDAYDRSMHHLDSLLKQILALADKYLESYEFIFCSDHGEEIGKGHGFMTKKDEMYRIPLIVKGEKWHLKINSLRRDKWFSSQILKYILLEMLGFELDQNLLQQEVSNSNIVFDGLDRITDFNSLQHLP